MDISFLTPADAASAFISPAAERAANVPGAALDCSGGEEGVDAPTFPGRSNDTVLPDVTPFSPPALPVMPTSLAGPPVGAGAEVGADDFEAFQRSAGVGALGVCGIEEPRNPGLS